MNALKLFLYVLLGAAFLSGCDSGEGGVALGTLERDVIRLSATANEIITDVYVREGDQVERGALLLQLDDRAFQAEVARSEAAMSAAQAYVSQLENGARNQELASAVAHVNQAEATANEAQRAYERAARLVEQNLLGQAQLD